MAILSKLFPNYSVFVSTFHATKLTDQDWKMPKLVEFIKSLTQEQDKLVMMGTSNLPKNKLWLLDIQGWIQKERIKLTSHLSKRETRTSL